MSSVAVDKHSGAQLLRGPAGGSSLRTDELATMARGHVDYKYKSL